MSTLFEPDELRALEERLTARLEALAPRPRPLAADRVRTEIAETPQRRGFRSRVVARRPAIAWSRAALAAVVVAAAVVIGIGIGQPGVLPIGRSTARPTEMSIVGGGTLTWSAPAVLPDGTRINDVIVWNGEYLAVGVMGDAPAVFVAHTGADWTALSTVGMNGHLPAARILNLGSRLAAISGQPQQSCPVNAEPCVGGPPTVWTSTDATHWSAIASSAWDAAFSDAGLTDVATGPHGVVAVGYAGRHAVVLQADDGVDWQAANLEAFAGAYPQAVVATPDGFVAVGKRGAYCCITDPKDEASAWWSTDGLTWQPASVENAGHGVALSHLLDGGSGMFAAGTYQTGGTSGMAGWRSEDGHSWSRTVALPASVADFTEFTSNGQVIFALGPPQVSPADDTGTLSAWVSHDGDRWDAVTMAGDVSDLPSSYVARLAPAGATAFLDRVFAVGDGLLMVGEQGREQVTWVGSYTSRAATPEPTKAATPAPTAVPNATANLPASTTFTAWTPVGMPDPSPQVFGGEWPYGVVEFKSQLIAIGAINGGCCDGGYTTDSRAVVWRSTDGRDWTLEPHRSAFALGRMQGIATDGSTLVAVGAVNLESTQLPGTVAPIGATWVSTDGTNWERFTGMPVFLSVAWMGERFYGITEESSSSSVWESPDGARWSRLRDFPGEFMTILRATPMGLVAAGAVAAPSSGPGVALWLSRDGLSWATVSLISSPQDIIRDVAASDSILVAIGQSETGGPAIWTESRDRVSGGQSIEDWGAQLERVVWTGTTFVALGEGDIGGTSSGPRAFTSADGVSWSLIPPNGPAFAGGGQVTWATVARDGLLAVVGAGEGTGGHHGVPLSWLVGP